ncbi:hypothetical protein [Sandaracinus amylolyticus]|uniref:Lipoprotein n=1 Tax=Sandaracinus amylolyticus TaxID=927083 RepID=A0A0F6W0S9_9BACT|nr:hypothetical protein [Sandaracinus amylolyticus]AKF04587.1 hypothetical protein DB32_001736 [Sandaracinus amylolyticus]
MKIHPSVRLAALALLSACGSSPCDRAAEACESPDPVVVSLFGTERIDACRATASGGSDAECNECQDVCGAPTETTELEVLGCFATAPSGASRRVLCLGEDYVPNEVTDAGNGAFAFQLWRGEPGEEVRDLSGEFEIVEDEGIIRFFLDEMPGEQLCAAVRLARGNGIATGDLDRECEADAPLVLGWANAEQPR